MNKRMNTQQILDEIEKEGGFDNWQHWNDKQLAKWVQNYFECSAYVAKKVAPHLRHGYFYNPHINA